MRRRFHTRLSTWDLPVQLPSCRPFVMCPADVFGRQYHNRGDAKDKDQSIIHGKWTEESKRSLTRPQSASIPESLDNRRDNPFRHFTRDGQPQTPEAHLKVQKRKQYNGPVTLEEFQMHMDQTAKPLKAATGPWRVGLAISGGVDSICLAHLAQRLQSAHPDRYNFFGMVVDHKARPESMEEAYTVQSYLGKQGIPTSVLEIEWPPGSVPKELSNFETSARKLRYRALGLECVRLGINDLLLAHHNDDQAETVLLKILRGHRGHGLAGISNLTRIPECNDIPKVYENPEGVPMPSGQFGGPAARGIWVHRPLLQISKDRLYDTCKAAGVPWIEDWTNADPTLTLRNTVRFLMHSDKLPEAMKKGSLLKSCDKVKKKLAYIEEIGSDCFRMMKISPLDLRVGRVAFTITSELKTFPFGFDSTVQALANALMRLVRVVTHKSKVDHDETLDIARALLLIGPPTAKEACESNMDQLSKSFTRGGVFWQKESSDGHTESVWSLNREPLRLRDEASHTPSCMWSNSTSATEPAMSSGPLKDHARGNGDLEFGSWTLFDGRFWLRVGRSPYSHVIARTLQPKDMERIRKEEASNLVEPLETKLKKGAPGKTRWTVPVLAEPVTDRVLVLPTFNFTVQETFGSLEWDVRYKTVDQADWQAMSGEYEDESRFLLEPK